MMMVVLSMRGATRRQETALATAQEHNSYPLSMPLISRGDRGALEEGSQAAYSLSRKFVGVKKFQIVDMHSNSTVTVQYVKELLFAFFYVVRRTCKKEFSPSTSEQFCVVPLTGPPSFCMFQYMAPRGGVWPALVSMAKARPTSFGQTNQLLPPPRDSPTMSLDASTWTIVLLRPIPPPGSPLSVEKSTVQPAARAVAHCARYTAGSMPPKSTAALALEKLS